MADESMVEIVARAIAPFHVSAAVDRNRITGWAVLDARFLAVEGKSFLTQAEAEAFLSRVQARAAIEAMRAPTAAMREAAREYARWHETYEHCICEGYDEMIDAAGKE